MNAINRAASSVFDVLLLPFEAMGTEIALILVSGLFGVLALICFKFISWQKGIKAAKDKIKGNMIAIRIYQDDLGIVGKSVGAVLLRNFQYLGLNFGPILPLFIPFMLVAAQFVVRYGFSPLPVVESEEVTGLLRGQGTLIEISMRPGHEAEVDTLEVRLPSWAKAVTPLARSQSEGLACIEIVALGSGSGEIEVLVNGQAAASKEIVAGEEPTRQMQPERVSSFWAAWLWPAEDTLPKGSPVAHIEVPYPERDLRFLPGGPFGVLLTFFLASIAFGILILKPLNIQI